MKRWLTAVTTFAVALPLALVAYAAPARAAAHHWVVSDYQCTTGAGVTICGSKQKAVYAGATHYRSRLTVTPEAKHWGRPDQLRQRDVQAVRTRNVCGSATCPRHATRWIGRWFDSGTVRMVDGWTVTTDTGVLAVALASTSPVGTPTARATVRCTFVAEGRACLRLDVQQVRNRFQSGLIAVVYPNSGASFTFQESSSGFGPSSGSVSCPACTPWTTRTTAAVGGFGTDRGMNWPLDDTWTDAARDPVIASLTLGVSEGPFTIEVSWPAS